MSKFHAIYGKGGVSPEPGGDTYGEVQTLLWTNTTPTNAFSKQTINLDLSAYDGVIIEYRESTSNNNISAVIKAAKGSFNNFGGGYGSDTGKARNILSVNNNGISFDSAIGNEGTNNSILIPLKIYGYKQYESGSISGRTQMAFQQNVEFDIGKGNYCITNIAGLNDANVTPSVGEVVCSSKYTESNVHIFTQLVKSDNGKVKMPYAGVYNIVEVGV